MKKIILSFLCLLTAGVLTAQTSIIPNTSVLPKTSLIVPGVVVGPVVTQLGTGTTTSTNNIPMTISAGAVAGSSIVVLTGDDSTSSAISTCADSGSGGSNTYQIDTNPNTGTFYVGICSSVTAHTISPGGTITLTYAAACGQCIAYAFSVTNDPFVASSWLDGTPGTFASSGAANGTATNSTTATATNDIAFTVWFGKSANTPLNITSGYATVVSSATVGTRMISIGWKEVANGGTIAATGTQAASDDLVGAVAGYKLQ